MIYDTEWTDDARRELRAIREWIGEASRWEIARLVARINDRIAIAPYTQGESRWPLDVRILCELPLCILYRIERFGGTAVVFHVRHVDQPPATT